MKDETAENSDDSQQPEMNQELHELFLDELADLLSAETQLVKALPKLIKAVHSDELRAAIASHLVETEGHVARLQQVAGVLGEKLKPKKCAAMEGLLKEADELLHDYKDKATLDAAIIAAAQKVEHYEIASYGTVRAWAQQMRHMEASELLDATLDEEKDADEKLTEIALDTANHEMETHK